VLVEAAAGGVGTLLVQLSRSRGTRVVAAAGGERKLALARELGAEVTVDYRKDGWARLARDAVGAVDVVFDGVGGAIGVAAFLRKTPEVARQSKLVENRLVLLPGMGPPIRSEPVAPPSVRQRAQRLHRNRCPGLAPSEPPFDVLLRPEEVHRASGEDDVVPPVRGGDQAMEQQAVVGGPAVAHFERDWLGTIGARRLDLTVYVQSCTDPERVPCAVAVPRASSSLDTVGRGYRRKGVGHPNRSGFRAEHERVCAVKLTPVRLDLGTGQAHGLCHLS
jgi:Zinc-binding dehydrogenase